MTKTRSFTIGLRTNVEQTKSTWTVSINQKVPSWQEALIFAWLAAWLLCGVAFVLELIRTEDTAIRGFLAVVMGFWGYFLVRVGKIYFWRKIGREEITITEGKLTIRNAMGKAGKLQVFALETISDLGTLPYNQKNIFQFMERAFWSLGGETIGFKSGKKKIILGKQLPERDSRDLCRLLEAGIKEFGARKTV
jgi:hypothetical protein